jgi:hypothetical protein
VTWEQQHAEDLQAIHDALHAVMNLRGTAQTDWLATVTEVREKVQAFSFFVPNYVQVITLLDLAEKLLRAVNAVQNIARDA